MTPKSVCTGSSDHHPEIEDAYMPSVSYQRYIQSLCARNPSLSNLHSTLANPNARRDGCHIVALDFRAGIAGPITRSIASIGCLPKEFTREAEKETERPSRSSQYPLQGRILIVENLTVEVINILGVKLEVDPLFLATHLHTVQRAGMRHQTPDDATLPSRLRQSNFISISYHQPVICEENFPSGAKFTLDAAIDRKLVFLRSTSIGLAQHRASIIKICREDDFWLALVLVDPPLGDTCFRDGNEKDAGEKVQLDLKPYLGAYENFMELQPFSQAGELPEITPKDSMFDDVIRYWEQATPKCFDPIDPSVQSLAYYPLRIVAAEWVKYIEVMQRCIKLYEYEGTRVNLEKFNMDLRELQSWRRRSMVSQQKIRAVIRHLKWHTSSRLEHCVDVDLILADFEAIKKDIDDLGRRLESMLPVVTSLVQIMDARQSLAETANISRLTVLALIFVPLSYVSSLFSMNSTNMPGSSHFWVYFTVAVPVTLVVFIIARPPTKDGVRQLLVWAQNMCRIPRSISSQAANKEWGKSSA